MKINDGQIKELRSEAGISGDTVMIEICDRALGWDVYGEVVRVGIQDHIEARKECSRIIDEAKAEMGD